MRTTMKESDKIASNLRYEAGNSSEYIREENENYIDFMNGDMERRNPFEALEYGIRWACHDADPSQQIYNEEKINELIQTAIFEYRAKHIGKTIGMFLIGFIPYLGNMLSATKCYHDIKHHYQGKK